MKKHLTKRKSLAKARFLSFNEGFYFSDITFTIGLFCIWILVILPVYLCLNAMSSWFPHYLHKCKTNENEDVLSYKKRKYVSSKKKTGMALWSGGMHLSLKKGHTIGRRYLSCMWIFFYLRVWEASFSWSLTSSDTNSIISVISLINTFCQFILSKSPQIVWLLYWSKPNVHTCIFNCSFVSVFRLSQKEITLLSGSSTTTV